MDSLFAPPAEDDDQLPAAGSQCHSHRHAAQIERGAFGVEPLSRGQEGGRARGSGGNEQERARGSHFGRRLAISFSRSAAEYGRSGLIRSAPLGVTRNVSSTKKD